MKTTRNGYLCLILFSLALSVMACSGGDSGLPAACDPECGPNGVCDAFSSPTTCRCFPGWAGQTCETCAPGYMDDGGGNCVQNIQPPVCDPACGPQGVCSGTVCQCFPGYAGQICEDCATGYSDDGLGNCVVDELPGQCTTGSCFGHGMCDDSAGTVVCTCNLGYTGDRCQLCQDGYHLDNMGGCIEDVICADFNPCGPHGTCDDSSGTSRCVCDEGYSGTSCEDCALDYHWTGSECEMDETCPAPDPCLPNGTCDDSSGSVECICDTGYTGNLCADCSPGYVDLGQGCELGASCDYYTFANNAYMYDLRLAGVEDEADCCFDFNGDAQMDNAYGAFIGAMGGLIGDFSANDMIASYIVSGQMCNIFDLQGLDSLADDDSVALSMMWGADSDNDYDNNLDGSEDFTVDRAAFVPDEQDCSTIPLGVFDSAELVAGTLSAQAQVVHGIYMPFPFAPDGLLEAPLHQARVEVGLSQGPHGILMGMGKLGGVLKAESFCEAINTYIAQECACLNLDGPMMMCGVSGEEYSITCDNSSNDQCDPQGAEEMCSTMNSYCAMMGPLLASVMDVDLDLDSIPDGFSVGLWFEATSANVTGITP